MRGEERIHGAASPPMLTCHLLVGRRWSSTSVGPPCSLEPTNWVWHLLRFVFCGCRLWPPWWHLRPFVGLPSSCCPTYSGQTPLPTEGYPPKVEGWKGGREWAASDMWNAWWGCRVTVAATISGYVFYHNSPGGGGGWTTLTS